MQQTVSGYVDFDSQSLILEADDALKWRLIGEGAEHIKIGDEIRVTGERIGLDAIRVHQWRSLDPDRDEEAGPSSYP
jgi:hypothetical protein